MKLPALIQQLTDYVELDVVVKLIRRDGNNVATHYKEVDICRISPDYGGRGKAAIVLEEIHINDAEWKELR